MRPVTETADEQSEHFMNVATEPIEHIASEGITLVQIIRASMTPTQTQFVTPDESNHQVGFVVYPKGGAIARHIHRPISRHITGTSEVLVVRKGRCEIDIYDDNRALIATRELHTGDVVIMPRGGHGFRMLEDTILLEVKQGPYTGQDEKACF